MSAALWQNTTVFMAAARYMVIIIDDIDACLVFMQADLLQNTCIRLQQLFFMWSKCVKARCGREEACRKTKGLRRQGMCLRKAHKKPCVQGDIPDT
jgi:hypothetical protein